MYQKSQDIHKIIIQTQKHNPNILQYPVKSSNISSKPYVLLTFFEHFRCLESCPIHVSTVTLSRRVTTAQTTDTTRATDRGSRNPKGITSARCCHVKSLVFLPSGELSHFAMERSTMLLMGFYPLFRLGHFQLLC